MIHLRMLGEIRLSSDEGLDVDSLLGQPKRLALLSYLASPSPGSWHRRDMVLALFWPELDTSRARTSLRNGIYVVRQALGEDIIRNRGDEEISVNPEMLRTDFAAVWDALRQGSIDEALLLYRGELLPGLFPQDSAGFQRWLDTERTRLKVAISNSAVERVNLLEKNGQLPEALAVARRVIDIQPDDETVVRRVMSLYEAIGDRAGGLGLFESYKARLAADYEAEPAAETISLAARLRATRTHRPSRPPDSPAPDLQAVPNGELLSIDSEPTLQPLGPVESFSTANLHASGRKTAVLGAVVVAAFSIGLIALANSRASRLPQLGRSTPLTAEEGLQVEAAISPNSRLVAYARGNSDRLRIFVQKIGGGIPWPLTADSNAIELVPRWAPDNDQILFLSQNSAYASPSIGGSPKLIVRGSEGDGMIRSASWSPAGDSVAFVRNDSLMVKALAGGGFRFVGRAAQLHTCIWSPEGSHIACVSGNVIALTPGPLFGNEAPSSIVVFPATGGKPRDLTGNNYEHKSPAWSADGRYLWFLSNRDGTTGETYAMSIDAGGKSSSPPVRVGLKAEWISLSAERAAYSIPVRKANIWSVPIPRDSSVTLVGAKQITFGNQVIEIMSTSRDGQWLVYDSNLPGNSDIYRVRVSGGAAERLTDDPRPEYAAELSPDNREIAWQRWVNGERHLFVSRLGADSAEEISGPANASGPHWSPDGFSIVAWSHTTERGSVFVVRRDKDGRWGRPAWKLDNGQLPVWSPDGRTVAFVRLDGSVETIPADSGTVQTLYAPRGGSRDPLVTYVVWSKERNVLWIVGSGPDGNNGIWEIDTKSNRRRLLVRLDLPPGKSYGPAIVSDGKLFYFTVAERSSNVAWTELIKR